MKLNNNYFLLKIISCAIIFISAIVHEGRGFCQSKEEADNLVTQAEELIKKLDRNGVKASEYLERAYAIYKQLDPSAAVAQSLIRMGEICTLHFPRYLSSIGVIASGFRYADVGIMRLRPKKDFVARYERGFTYYNRAIRIYRSLGDNVMVSFVLQRIAMGFGNYPYRKYWSKAIFYYEQALKEVKSEANPEYRARILDTLGNMYLGVDKTKFNYYIKTALEEYQKAASYYRAQLSNKKDNLNAEEKARIVDKIDFMDKTIKFWSKTVK